MDSKQVRLFEPQNSKSSTSQHDQALRSHTYDVWVDGAARGNPGKSGAGVYVRRENKEIIRKGFFLGHQTNNSAEYISLALGLFFVKQDVGDGYANINIFSDSQLLVRQMQGIYAIRMPHIQKLRQVIQRLTTNYLCSYKHITREENTIADELANLGIDKKIYVPEEFARLLLLFGLEVPRQ